MTPAPVSPAAGRLSVAERLARLLGVIPWVVGRGGAHVGEISEVFDYPAEQLLEDLTQVVFFVGVHPFTPDTLIEVDIADEIVDIRYADWFSKPLRLTEAEAARLLAAGRSVLGMVAEPTGTASAGSDRSAGSDGMWTDGRGTDNDGTVRTGSDGATEAGPLTRALAKLSLALGDGAADAATHIDVCLGEAPTATLDAVRAAVTQHRRVEIEYYSLGRDALTERAVDPARVFSHDGEWYLSGWCHRAGAERVFRVDRIRSVTVTDAPAQVDLAYDATPGLGLDDDGPAATLRLSADAAWAADYYPTRRRAELGDGRVEADFPVTNMPWLARLLLQLGPSADMVAQDEPIDGDLRTRAARRVLERYGP